MRTAGGKISPTHQNKTLALLDTPPGTSIFVRTSGDIIPCPALYCNPNSNYACNPNLNQIRTST